MVHEGLIQADSVSKTFTAGHMALQRVNLRIPAGEFVSIIGPSGCGKSTLLRLIAGLDRASGGRLTVGGDLPLKTPHCAAFVFQDPNLLPWRNVLDNICLPLELQGIERSQRLKLAQESTSLVGLTERDANKRPRMLSGGMRMRVSLARALVTNPNLLLMDEPFGSLDDILRQRLNEELLRIWSNRRWTVVFVTHNVSEAVFLSQRVLIMSGRPGTIMSEVAIPFPFPRTSELRADAEFARLTGEISGHLREHELRDAPKHPAGRQP